MCSLRARRGPVIAMVVILTLAAGCGSDDGDAAGPVTTSGAPTTTGPTTTTPSTTIPTTTIPDGGADATVLTDDDRAAIEGVFVTFFGGAATSVDEKVAVLEDGERYRAMLEDAAENEQFQQLTTEIRDVVGATPAACLEAGAEPPCALVTHDLLVAGFPMAAAIESPAVTVDGSWRVGAAAWCGVVAIGGESCP